MKIGGALVASNPPLDTMHAFLVSYAFSWSRAMVLTTEDLFASLKRDIEDGTLAPGEQLLSISGLQLKYDVGKGVAQNALARLREAGLVVTRPGGKTFVQGRHERLLIEEPELMLDAVRDVEVLSVAEVPAPIFVAEKMQVPEGMEMVRRLGVVRQQGRVIRQLATFIPASIARGSALVYTELAGGGVHALLADLGFAPNRLTVSVISRVADAAEEMSLDLRKGTYVLEVTRLAWSGRRCVEYVRAVLDSNAHELRFNLTS